MEKRYSKTQHYKGYIIGGYGVFKTPKSIHPTHMYDILEEDKTELITEIRTLKDAKAMIDEMAERIK